MPTDFINHDTRRIDWLEEYVNENGSLLLHTGGANCHEHPGLGLRPGSMERTLREAIDGASGQTFTLDYRSMLEGVLCALGPVYAMGAESVAEEIINTVNAKDLMRIAKENREPFLGRLKDTINFLKTGSYTARKKKS